MFGHRLDCDLHTRPVYMIDLPEDFRDILIELHDAGAQFVLVGKPCESTSRRMKELTCFTRGNAVSNNNDARYRVKFPDVIRIARHNDVEPLASDKHNRSVNDVRCAGVAAEFAA